MEESRKILKEKAEQFKNEYDLDLFMEASPKTGKNCTKIFVEAAKLLYNEYEKYKKDKDKDCEKLNKQKIIQNSNKCLFKKDKDCEKLNKQKIIQNSNKCLFI